MNVARRGSSFIDDEVFLSKHRYILNKKLGEGSYATVKRGYSEDKEKMVALKIIDRRKAPKDFREKFLPRELEILKVLDHPNITKVFEILENSCKVYIVMEYAGHGDLLDYIKLHGVLPEPKARTMYHQMCQAVNYLHSNHIAHRDLKCENLLLDTDNNIKVTDFGFARFFGDITDLCSTYCGSMAYAAPEIVQGISYHAPQHDIWALGVVLFIMLCAEMPFDDSDPHQMLRDQLQGNLRFPNKTTMSLVARDLIENILQVNVSGRYTLIQIFQHPWMNTEGTSTTLSGIPVSGGTSIDGHESVFRQGAHSRDHNVVKVSFGTQTIKGLPSLPQSPQPSSPPPTPPPTPPPRPAVGMSVTVSQKSSEDDGGIHRNPKGSAPLVDWGTSDSEGTCTDFLISLVKGPEGVGMSSGSGVNDEGLAGGSGRPSGSREKKEEGNSY